MRWYTADFDRLDWRDVRVHGFRIVVGEGDTAELQLDIDFILERPATADARYRIAQAMLQFHDVVALRLTLDYVACSAGTSAFSIEGVAREPLRGDAEADDGRDDAYGPWRWRIPIAWPEGALEFEASGFSQWLVGEPVTSETSSLPASLRM